MFSPRSVPIIQRASTRRGRLHRKLFAFTAAFVVGLLVGAASARGWARLAGAPAFEAQGVESILPLARGEVSCRELEDRIVLTFLRSGARTQSP